MEVLILDGKDGDGLGAPRPRSRPTRRSCSRATTWRRSSSSPKPEYVSAGLPTTDARPPEVRPHDRPRDRRDGARRGQEAHTRCRCRSTASSAPASRAARARWRTSSPRSRPARADDPVLAEAVRAGAPTFADVLKKTIIYFTYPNPDGWRRGTFDTGGLGSSFQRYNGNGVDPNRDYTDIGYNFRGYSGGSEPETRAFKGFYDDVRAGGGHVPRRRRPPRPAVRRRALLHADAARPARPRQGHAHPRGGEADQPRAVRRDEVVSDHQGERGGLGRRRRTAAGGPLGATCPQIYAQTWGSVYDTINYTTTGTLGDWFDSTAGLSADGIDNEMSFSHVDKQIVFEPNTEQLHVAGNKAIIYAHVARPARAGHRRARRARHAGLRARTCGSRAPRATGQPGPPPDTVAQDDDRRRTTLPRPDRHGGRSVYKFTVERTAPSGGDPGIFNGGMRDRRDRRRTSRASRPARSKLDDPVPALRRPRRRRRTPTQRRVGHGRRGLQPVPPALRPGRRDGRGQPARRQLHRRRRRQDAARRVAGVVSTSPLGIVGLPIGPVAHRHRLHRDAGDRRRHPPGGDDPPRARRATTSPTRTSSRTSTSTSRAADERFQTIDPRKVIDGDASRSTGCTTSCSPTSCCRATPARSPASRRRRRAADGDHDVRRPPAHDGPRPGAGVVRAHRRRRPTGSTSRSPPTDDERVHDGAHRVGASRRTDYDLFVQRKVDDELRSDVDESASFVDHRGDHRRPDGRRPATTASRSSTARPPPADPFDGHGDVPAVRATVPPSSDYTEAEKDAWVAKLRGYVTGGGNLVLTDGALRGPARSSTPVAGADKVNRQTVYVGPDHAHALQGRRLRRPTAPARRRSRRSPIR